MPDIRFLCPLCGQSIEAPEEMAKQSVACPTYDQMIGIPGVTETTGPQSPSAPVPFRATPKQIAFLSYLGAIDAGELSKSEASLKIDSLLDGDKDGSLRARADKWPEERARLYPELYSEMAWWEEVDLSESLHAYVRSRVVGASERLTKEKIQVVMRDLAKGNASWWKKSGRNEDFFERLRQVYPGCCDGRVTQTAPQSGSGCLLTISLVGLLLAICGFYFLR